MDIMNKMELELKRDDLIKQLKGLQEQVQFIDDELKGFNSPQVSEDNKPEIMYNNYKSW